MNIIGKQNKPKQCRCQDVIDRNRYEEYKRIKLVETQNFDRIRQYYNDNTEISFDTQDQDSDSCTYACNKFTRDIANTINMNENLTSNEIAKKY